MLGRVLGGQKSLRIADRIGLGLIMGVLGGLIIYLLIANMGIIEATSLFAILNVLFMVGGIGFGASTNWQTPVEAKMKSHIIYDPDEDDEEFDRQIEEAFKGSN